MTDVLGSGPRAPFADLLQLEAKGDDRFVIRPDGEGFLFGGLSLAMVLRGAYATIDDAKVPLSLNASFLAAGTWEGPHEVTVSRVMDSRAFSVRRIDLVTGGRLAMSAEAMFHHPEDGDDWAQVAPPYLAAPEALDGLSMRNPLNVGETRPGPRESSSLEREHPYWARLHDLGGDPMVTACALAFVSDYMVVFTPFEPLSGQGDGMLARTVGHSLFFHRPPVDDDWWFVDCPPFTLSSGRFASRGTIQSRDGTLLASFAQEGIVRTQR
jgi:acyl-CoA thioesterase-2